MEISTTTKSTKRLRRRIATRVLALLAVALPIQAFGLTGAHAAPIPVIGGEPTVTVECDSAKHTIGVTVSASYNDIGSKLMYAQVWAAPDVAGGKWSYISGGQNYIQGLVYTGPFNPITYTGGNQPSGMHPVTTVNATGVGRFAIAAHLFSWTEQLVRPGMAGSGGYWTDMGWVYPGMFGYVHILYSDVLPGGRRYYSTDCEA